MKISAIHVRKEDLDLTRPYSIAYKTVTAVSNCVVEMETDSGNVGFGSANPSKYVVGVDVDDTVAALSEENTEWLIGKDVREMQQLVYEVQKKFAKQPGACAALDIALHDLFAQQLGLPLVKFLGQKHKSLPTSITIGIKNIGETIEEAEEYIGRGFKILKVKLGQSKEEDIERLKKLREQVGKEIVIRVDANQGYTMLQLEDFYYATFGPNPELIEQPLPANAIAEYRKLPTEIKKMVALDETLVTPANAYQLTNAPQAAGIFNIKLMKCGGIGHAREIANIAKNAKINLMWGCNDESRISIAAALHVALASSNTKYLDLDGSLDLARDLVTGGFELHDGVMSLTDQPGLGVRKVE
ncbi:mandelate racemase/muconate lactonizing enzyme family protein [Tunicatimonas pelagia]|uniref:mandelate racemase/muconate lactonizing enzyme family protein n=1 Tax=Tunicatimonas pelagia TaxID=931531 RepID=UPI002665D4AC|nr:dipeptide epimerase [Tunicatimonas pelagia]WKN43892.1 dipeptide epimerase [Tunicatimonas pelagia]